MSSYQLLHMIKVSVFKVYTAFQYRGSNRTSYPYSAQGKCEWRKQVATDPSVCTYTLSMHA